MKQQTRIKGINFNYDLPDQIFVVGLDSGGIPEIQQIGVLGISRTKLLKLNQKIKVKPISKMHWDAVCKHSGGKTIPYKSLSVNPSRGYVFQSKRFAIARIAHLRNELTRKAEDTMNHAALVAARHDKYLQELLKE
jgi:hypothetical protein